MGYLYPVIITILRVQR